MGSFSNWTVSLNRSTDLWQQLALRAVNASTSAYGVNPLPPNAIAVDGSWDNASAPAYGAVVIQRVQPAQLPGAETLSVVYGVMSAIIGLAMIKPLINWARDATIRQARLMPGPAPRSRPLTGRELGRELARFYPPPTDQPPPPSYAETLGTGVIPDGGDVTAADLRACRELMRVKYALDTEIWSLGEVTAEGRHVVEDMKRRSDSALAEIQRIVEGWQGPRWSSEHAGTQWTPEELELVQEIQLRVREMPRGQYGQPAAPAAPAPEPNGLPHEQDAQDPASPGLYGPLPHQPAQPPAAELRQPSQRSSWQPPPAADANGIPPGEHGRLAAAQSSGSRRVHRRHSSPARRNELP